ncbi:hypothetical protein DK419_21765 [Methylobacterium terrae]|uniref:Uncharacterized protein n=1 Tax=Methylobacterium terrae TaxID=2202827 RepID=A0A2U8WR42_9HYPH|nr:hypothetical protein [Methylobacterium terrae]AWN48659.1 hypothetical protein DK419_21765 [Methylobacterium terrae]
MTTISASSAAAQPVSMPRQGSPGQRILDQIAAQQQAGSLSDADAGALTSAVQDIGQALSSSSGAAGGTRLDPAQAKSRMDDLIAAEVDKGTLTSDQATTLKSLMSSHKGGNHGGPGGEPGGAGGPPPGPPPADAAGSAGAASGAASASDVLSGFLKRLQDAQGQAQGSGYGAGGGTAAQTSQAAVFDFQV